ncbi:MAG: iron-sulfur cluster assembly scaffold protein [Mycobacterium sp.]|nr:iron-sulfur cluster assembly scaffold protein [Mycobacterium sp.]
MARFSPTIVDHFTSPRNCGRLPSADVAAFVGNPVCGDQILLTARVDGDAVSDVTFEAFGCSASLAIASILTERLTGLTVPEVAAVTTDQVLQWSGGLSPDQRHVAELGADVAHRLAGNYCNGLSDDGLSCGA